MIQETIMLLNFFGLVFLLGSLIFLFSMRKYESEKHMDSMNILITGVMLILLIVLIELVFSLLTYFAVNLPFDLAGYTNIGIWLILAPLCAIFFFVYVIIAQE